MKILLLGEYSNVHATLADGLRMLGHQVTVLSNGDFWKDYPRDIDLSRRIGKWGGILYMAKLYAILPRLRHYDIVQLINPMFLEIKAERIFPIYRYLRKHNTKLILGGFGMDYYWANTCSTTMPLRYSDFNIGKKPRLTPDAVRDRKEWIGTPKAKLNQFIAQDCDGIVTGLYEYWICYHQHFPQKTTFIPFPIKIKEQASKELDILTARKSTKNADKIKIFIGINKSRNEYKGTDIMLRAAQDVQRLYPQQLELKVAESVPFQEYIRMMQGSDAILDQLYSYTPSMNPLEAMSHGIICIGGGEPENYQILHEDTLRPIINVEPTYESVYKALQQLVLHPNRIPQLQEESIAYIKKHHEYVKVAKKYEAYYQQILTHP